jgi:hypothetical protein
MLESCSLRQALGLGGTKNARPYLKIKEKKGSSGKHLPSKHTALYSSLTTVVVEGGVGREQLKQHLRCHSFIRKSGSHLQEKLSLLLPLLN